ncbi:MAG TPA: hypothetical protein VFM31_06560 [Nitrososphaeraceae archaeon]|nr:hypothetical protein [Nitrososphaeraceae archaeon]
MDLLIYQGIGEKNFPISKNMDKLPLGNNQISTILKKSKSVSLLEEIIENIQLGKQFFLINNKPHAAIKIYDKEFISKIMRIYLNDDNLGIFYCLKIPLTIQEIVNQCKMPLSTAYRRVSFLLSNGYLQVTGCSKSFDKKNKSTKYEKTISGITINVNEKPSITLFIKKSIVDESKFLQVANNEF